MLSDWLLLPLVSGERPGHVSGNKALQRVPRNIDAVHYYERVMPVRLLTHGGVSLEPHLSPPANS
jgi:hypothetical protein